MLVVSGTFSELARKMLHVQHQLSGDKTCDFTECQVAIGSEDAMGDAAQAFNGLVESLAHSRKQHQFLNEFVLTLTRSLERDEIWDVGLQGLLENTGCQGIALLLGDEGRLRIVRSFDELAGIYNRRFGWRRLKEEVARAQREGTFLSVAMIDLDHFKRVNDTFGHLAGDQVLKQLSAR